MGRYSRQLLVRTCLLEGGLLGIAAIWALWQGIPLRTALTPTLAHCVTGVISGCILLAGNYVIVEYGSRYSSLLHTIKTLIETDVSPLFRHIDVWTMIFIAIISGVAEEIFFRGVVQSQIGIWLSSLVFGLAHIWKKTAILYGIYAALIGFVFGAMYIATGNLWVPILAHVVNNFVAIFYYTHCILKPESPIT